MTSTWSSDNAAWVSPTQHETACFILVFVSARFFVIINNQESLRHKSEKISESTLTLLLSIYVRKKYRYIFGNSRRWTNKTATHTRTAESFIPVSRTGIMAAVEGAPGSSLSLKMSAKLLRHKAQEFLASRKHANNLVDIIAQWDVSFKHFFQFLRCFPEEFLLAFRSRKIFNFEVNSTLLPNFPSFIKLFAFLCPNFRIQALPAFLLSRRFSLSYSDAMTCISSARFHSPFRVSAFALFYEIPSRNRSQFAWYLFPSHQTRDSSHFPC